MHTTRATSRKDSLASLRRKTLPLSLSLLLCGALASGPAQAASVARTATPTGGTIVGGSGAILQDGASVVINQASHKLVLNWQSFNLGQDATVLFNQPGRSAVALNRILDQNPSQIFGQISSNGQVFLINTHGIIFGTTAKVNVGGLVASTLDLTPADFLSDHFNLDAVGGGAGIVNHGTIAAASGGSVSLIGGSVQNDGVILANYGRINLDGAEHAVLDFDGNGLINVQITGELEQRLDARAAVSNAGTLQAEGGTVVLEAAAARDLFTNLVNNSGVIDAGAISHDGGVVRLVAKGGDVIESGSVDATGVHGGSVRLLSDRNVGVIGGGIDASGASGGGDIRVGGGWQGGEGLQTAEAVYVAPDATLKADATRKGDGGSVVVWGNRANNFYGIISARGGASGGDGGQVETSAHDGLNAQGRVDASAPAGRAGSWLLDPHDVSIVAGGTEVLAGASPDRYFSAIADDSRIDPTVVDNALVGGTNVSIFTGTDGTQNGDITVTGAIDAPGQGSLYLKAAGSIFVDNDITGTSGSGPLNLYLWANYGGAASDETYTSRADCATCTVLVGRNDGSIGIDIDRGVLDVRTGDANHAGGIVAFGNGTPGSTGSIHAGAFAIHANGITMGWGNYLFDSLDTTLDAGTGNIALVDTTAGSGLSFGGDLVVSGNQITLGGATTAKITAKSQSYAGSVTLGADTTLVASTGAVSLAGNLAGGGNDLTITGNAVLGAASGLGTLSVSGTTTLDGDVTTTGTQAYAGAVTVGGDAILTSSGDADIDFGSTVDGAHALTVNTGGVTDFGGAIGATTALTSLTTDAPGSTTLAGDVTTSGAQAYGDAVTLAADAILASTGSGDIGFGSTLDGVHELTVNTGGTTYFGGAVGATTALTSLATDAPGGTLLGGGVTTSGAQAYGDAVALISDAVLTSTAGGDVGFGSTVDGAHTLTVNTAGATRFGGALGATTALTSLTTDAAGSTALGGNVTTAGAQTYNDAVGLTADAILTTTGNADIDFGSTVDGAHALTVNTGGISGFGGAVGATTALAGLATDAAGSTMLGGDVTTSGAQSYGGAMTLTADRTFTSTAGGDIVFGSTVDGAYALTANTAGATRFGGAVGATTALTGLTTDAAGSTTLGGNVTTTSTQTYNDAVGLTADAVLASTGNGDIRFGSTMDGAGALTVNTGGVTGFGGAVGATTALTSLTTDAAGSTALGGDVTTSGAQTYNDAVNLAADATLTNTSSSDIDFGSTVDGAHALMVNTAGDTLFGGAVGATTALTSLATDALGRTILGGDVRTTGAQAYDDFVMLGADAILASTGSGDITFGSTVDGAYALTVNTAGTTRFGDTVGAIAKLTSLTTDAPGSTALGGDVTTSGAQTYNDALDLTANATLSSMANGNIDFGSTVDGAHMLLVFTGGGTRFGGTVGATTALTGLATDGTGSLALGGDVTTSGAQNYGEAMALTADRTFTSTAGGDIMFGSTVDGAHALTVNTAGATRFGGAVGATTALTSLTSDAAGSTTLGGNVTTTGAQTYDDAVGLTADAILTSTGNADIGFGSTVDGAHALTVDTGGITGFGGAIGATTALTGLATDAPGSTALGGDVTTSGAQAYGDAVTLTTDVTVASTAGDIGFGATVDGPHALTANAAGALGFNGVVGGVPATSITALTGLTTNSTTFSAASTLNVDGDLSVTTTGGAIGQAGLFNVTGTARFDAANQGILLDNAGNAFGGAVSLANTGAANVVLVNGGSLLLGDVSTGTGQLSLTSLGGGISQASGTIVGQAAGAGAVTVDAKNAVDLSSQGNDFTGAVSATSTDGGVSIGDANDLLVSTLASAADQDVSLIAGGVLLLPGAIGTGAGDLALASNGGALATAGSLSGRNVSLTGRDGVSLQNDVTTSDTLSLTSEGGPISQFGGVLTVGGSSDIDAGAGTIALANGLNDFIGAVGLTGAATQIADRNALTLGNVATGSLTVASSGSLNLGTGTVAGVLTALSQGGAISEAGPLSVTGTSSIDAGVGTITLTDTGNDFTGAVSLTGGTTQVTDENTLVLGTLATGNLTANSTGALNLGTGTVTGTLAATSHNGAIGETGPLGVTGASTIDAGTGAITLADADNDFAGTVNLIGGTTQITDRNALTLGNVATGSLTADSTGALNLGTGTVTGTLAATSHNGAIGEAGPLGVTGASTIDAGTGAITLADASNDFAGAVNLTGSTTQITDKNALILGTLATGDLTANSTGALNLGTGTVTGTLTAASHDGAIGEAGPLGVTGTSTISAGSGAISLTDADNDFAGTVNLAGGTTQITDENALTLGTLATGSLTADSTGTLNLGTGAVTGNLAATSHGGAIGEGGPLKVTGTANLDAGTGAITLTDAGNDFAGATSLKGGTTKITDKNALALGTLATGSLTADSSGTLNLGTGVVTGNLAATSHGGAIGEGGPLQVTGTANLDAGTGAITLTDASNDFVGATSLKGGTTKITDKNALTLGTLATGSLTANSTGTLNLGTGVVTGNLAATSHGGAIGESGPLKVTGTSNLDAGTGAIALADAGNDFQGSVNLAGKGIAVSDATDLAIGTLVNAANSAVNLAAGDNLLLPATAIATGTADLSLAAGRGTLATQAALSGANVSLNGGNGVDLGHDVSASGTLTLASASGDIKQTAGTLTAHTLTGSAGGSATLERANAIDRLGRFTANGFSLVDAGALAVTGPVDGGTGGVTLHSGAVLSVAGDVEGSRIALQGTGGIRQSAGTIDAGTGQVTLASGAGIAQTGGGIVAGTLVGNAGGDASLASANRIDRLGSFSASNLSLSNRKALAVNGPVNVSGDIALATTAGKLSLNTDLTGGNVALTAAGNLVLGGDLAGDGVVLRSGGTISQGSGNTIAANRLSGQSAGATTLDQANAIGGLGSFRANGLSLTSARALTVDGTVDGGGSTRLIVGGDLAIAGTLAGDATTLVADGAISETAGGGITAHTLDGHATGAASLTGANRVDTLGAFTAAGFALSNGPSLTVAGPLDGGDSVSLATTRGDLLINGKVSGKTTTLASSGAIIEGTGGSVTADTLSGHAGGATRLGTAASPLDNYIGTLGGFSSPAGFSLTNAQTLTLAAVGGSSYTVDAGTSSLYLGVTGGDLLQVGTTWLYDGEGTFSSSGRIGTADAPIYVTGTGPQAVALVGLPPAYFYAVTANGNLLPLTGGSSVNVPTSLFTSRAQNANNHTDVYIDPSVISANYRSFGIVPSGILLPPDQQDCDPELEVCDE